MTTKYWGYHLMLDCNGCDKAKITDRENLKKFVTTLVERIDMVAYGAPWAEHFAEHDPSKAGYSLYQMISTSNISGHFVDETGQAYLDVFSCKTFDIETVKETVREFFGAKGIKELYVVRDAS